MTSLNGCHNNPCLLSGIIFMLLKVMWFVSPSKCVLLGFALHWVSDIGMTLFLSGKNMENLFFRLRARFSLWHKIYTSKECQQEGLLPASRDSIAAKRSSPTFSPPLVFITVLMPPLHRHKCCYCRAMSSGSGKTPRLKLNCFFPHLVPLEVISLERFLKGPYNHLCQLQVGDREGAGTQSLWGNRESLVSLEVLGLYVLDAYRKLWLRDAFSVSLIQSQTNTKIDTASFRTCPALRCVRVPPCLPIASGCLFDAGKHPHIHLKDMVPRGRACKFPS